MNKNNIFYHNINMKKDFYRYLVPILCLCFISIFSIYFSKNVINNYESYLIKQIVFIIIGFIMLFIVRKMNINIFYKYSFLFYIISVLMLIYVLFFGKVINGSKSWINMFSISIQPSEFAKVSILLCLDKYIYSKYGLLKSIILVLIPSILTFLQPDTGTVLFYLIMFFSIFISMGLKKKYYIGLFGLSFIFVIGYFYLYFFQSELFLNLFGTSFFYRTDRIINFMKSEGFQINNALLGIGNGRVFGNLGRFIVYIPEVITDFMFANVLTIFGFVGGCVILVLFYIIDRSLLNDIRFCEKHKFFIIGLFGVFLYQQIQHIFMNIGLLPITGITLPFISYGGSSLISYFILFGILLNLKKYQIDT